MKVPRTSERASASANMTPMIDVVFLLIIFFLVSSHLAKRENRLPLDLPAAQTHLVNDRESNRLVINIDDQGIVQIGSTAVSTERQVALLSEHGNQHGQAAAVRIRTAKSVTYGLIEPLLRDITQAGIVDITFAVKEASAK